jgi:hypothetical protein
MTTTTTPHLPLPAEAIRAEEWEGEGYDRGRFFLHWTYRTCDQAVYRPPLNTHCAALERPAAVRISTGGPW